MDTIFTIGIFLSFFLAILLVTKKSKNLADTILGIWLFIIAIHLLGYFIYTLGFWDKYPHLVGTTLPFPLLHGPMLYLYTLYSLRNENKLRRLDYLHFTPALLCYLYMLPFYFTYTEEQKVLVDNGLLDYSALFSTVVLISFFVSGLAYPIISYHVLGKHKKLIDDNFSYDNCISLDWLKYSIWGIGAVYVSAVVISILREGLGMQFTFNADYIFYLIIILFVFCIGFFGIRQQNLFSENGINKKAQLVQEKQGADYKKSGLKSEVAKEVHQRLTKLMTEQKFYTNPKLTLNELAQSVEVSPNHLSQIINQYEEVNFHDFVNRYRVEEFIKNASAHKEITILSHALDAGFNSKSSFNSVFKKHRGLTPSTFIDQLAKKT
ncbi:MAG: AraC family transcriptional regulator [Calditrichaeota bacterium]|nr:MAG: AraC family transcriptional regulator [Calditrichota bacterium]MBL1207445.1 AraC family transcriptional regulator [Calditrichota bacterium]NOG47277.1 helix-turn-helix transcriptional regulator [Calditrichota bacterium]